MNASKRDRLVAVAEIARAHGIQGEVRLKLYNTDSELLFARPKVVLRLKDGSQRDVRIGTIREADKAVLLRFDGVSDRNNAELLHGAAILVHRNDFPELEDGEFYACDIEGADVRFEGASIGTAIGIHSYPTCDVLRVRSTAGKEIEVPLTDAYVESVNTDSGLIELRALESD